MCGNAPRAAYAKDHHKPTVADGSKRPSFKLVAIMVRATVRMLRDGRAWSQKLALRDQVQKSLMEMKKQQSKTTANANITPQPKRTIQQMHEEEYTKTLTKLTNLTKESIQHTPTAQLAKKEKRHPMLSGIDVTGTLESLRAKMAAGGYGSTPLQNPRLWSLNTTAKKDRKKARGERALEDGSVELMKNRGAPEIGRSIRSLEV